MIYDHLDQQHRYRSVHPGLDLAFDYLLTFQPGTPDGKYPIDGDRVFALVQSYTTGPAPERKYESHEKYVDLQYIVSGEELFLHSPLSRLNVTDPYAEARDCALYSGQDQQGLVMRAGDFAVLFPHDGHKPGCTFQTAGPVNKVVLKIRV